jgi:hypothetical protein
VKTTALDAKVKISPGGENTPNPDTYTITHTHTH